MKNIELLAPAKDFQTLVAAVDYGADAVYIGGAKFGARHAATNSIEQIARAVEYAHQYGVRIHATLNTLLYDSELADAEAQARELIAAGVDALIVQDMALRRMNLPVELHASTQMCNMTVEQVRFLEQCGFARVILERALSIDDIRRISATTDVELECFVHGAICVGYSGRCFMSRSIGSRSGNRGECSQPCRLTYDLVDSKNDILIKGRHLLSVRDLNLSSRLGELLDAGVTSFKIEGRLKDVGYVKNIVGYYRRALDKAIAKRDGLVRASVGESVIDFTPDTVKSFTRGESEYFVDGVRSGVASFDTPKSIGEYLGRVVKVDSRGFVLDKIHPIASGDGICFGALGTNVNSVDGVRVVPNKMDGIEVGVEVYRNYDHRFNQQLERSRTRRVIAVDAFVEVVADAIRLRYVDCEGVVGEVVRMTVLEPANSPEKMVGMLRTQLLRSGDTIFVVSDVSITGAEWFVPVSVICDMRREALELLRIKRLERPLNHLILPDNESVRHPDEQITAEDGVTNHLAEEFYRAHGVKNIERGLDLESSMKGRRVMQSSYCLRREIGECLLEKPTLTDDLYLVRGATRYRLDFDCARCRMAILYCED